MKYSDIIKLSLKDLNEKIFFEKNNLNKLKFSHAISKIENPMKIRYFRKLIAKLKTARVIKILKNNDYKKKF
jgi:large subunit ribosomal protein L29